MTQEEFDEVIRDRAEESEASRKLAALKSEIEWDNMKMKDD